MYLNHLAKIQSTRSRNEKLHHLEEAKDDYIFRQILYYAYHPLWHYHLTNVKTTGLGFGTLEREPWMTLLDRLEARTLSGYEARQEVELFIAGLTYTDGEVFKKILKKNLRIGISITTINASNVGVQIPVFGAMLAKTYSGELTQPMYISIKYDGVRAIYKNGTLYTRNGHEITGCKHILEQAKKLGNGMLDGELLIPRIPFQKSSGLIRSFSATPTAIYKVFDTPNDKPFIERYELMKDLFNAAHNSVPNMTLVKHVLVNSENRVQQAYQKVLDAGFEGLVLKDPQHVYVPKRSSSWLKLKAINSIDVPVIGVFEGKGKFENNLGGVKVCMPDGTIVKVGGGFSDNLRSQIWNNPNEYIGDTVEIGYHEITPDGSLRHPRLVKFRPDK